MEQGDADRLLQEATYVLRQLTMETVQQAGDGALRDLEGEAYNWQQIAAAELRRRGGSE